MTSPVPAALIPSSPRGSSPRVMLCSSVFSVRTPVQSRALWPHASPSCRDHPTPTTNSSCDTCISLRMLGFPSPPPVQSFPILSPPMSACGSGARHPLMSYPLVQVQCCAEQDTTAKPSAGGKGIRSRPGEERAGTRPDGWAECAYSTLKGGASAPVLPHCWLQCPLDAARQEVEAVHSVAGVRSSTS